MPSEIVAKNLRLVGEINVYAGPQLFVRARVHRRTGSGNHRSGLLHSLVLSGIL
jgi:hypothetical protein